VTTTADRVDRIDPVALLPEPELRRARRWAFVAIALKRMHRADRAAPDRERLAAAGGPRRPAPFDGATLSAVPLVGDLEAVLVSPAYARRAIVRFDLVLGRRPRLARHRGGR